MNKYKKKVIYSKMGIKFKSDKNIIIGQLSNIKRIEIWKEFKETYELFIPKNKLVKKFFKENLVSSVPALNAEAFVYIFEGPIFCLSIPLPDISFCNVLVKMNKANIPLYGGIFKGKFYNFAEIQEIEYLLRKKEKKAITIFIAQPLFRLSFLNPFFSFQFLQKAFK